MDRKHSVKANESVVVRGHYFNQIANDDEMPLSWLADAYRVLKPNSAMYAFVHWTCWGIFEAAVKNAGFAVKNMIVMNKSNHGMGDKFGYAPKHELLLFATKGRHVMTFPGKRDNNVWDVPVKFSGSKRLHPNEKPLSWFDKPILNSSKAGDVILDPFMGSGSTGVAAILMGRSFVGIEIDATYFQVARRRLDDAVSHMSGQIAFSDQST